MNLSKRSVDKELFSGTKVKENTIKMDTYNTLNYIDILLNDMIILFNLIFLFLILYILIIFMLIPYNVLFNYRRHYYNEFIQ